MDIASDPGSYDSDPQLLAAIGRRLAAQGAPVSPGVAALFPDIPLPTTSGGTPAASAPPSAIFGPSASSPSSSGGLFGPRQQTSSSDPFSGLSGVGNFLGGVGNAVGSAFQWASQRPVIGGALQGLSALGDATVGTPIGLAALGADQLLGTGLTAAAERANAGRPIWELPKTAASVIGQGLGQVADNPTADPFSRAIAGGARTIENVGSLVAPIPGLGEIAGAAGRFVRGGTDAADAARLAAFDRRLSSGSEPSAPLALPPGEPMGNAVNDIGDVTRPQYGTMPMGGAIAEPSPRGVFAPAAGPGIEPPIEGQFREIPPEPAALFQPHSRPLSPADIAAIPSDTPAPIDVRVNAVRSAEAAGQDPAAAVRAADARWQAMIDDARASRSSAKLPVDEQAAANARVPSAAQQAFAADLRRQIVQRQAALTPAQRLRQFIGGNNDVGGLTGRGITTTPVGRGDLIVKNPRVLAGPAAEAPGVAELRARTDTTPLTPITPRGPLGARLLENESPIVQAAARGESWVTPELMAKHYANEDLRGAAKANDAQGIGEAIDSLASKGAKVSNTVNHLRAGGIDIPRGSKFGSYDELRAFLGGGARPAASLEDRLTASVRARGIDPATGRPTNAALTPEEQALIERVTGQKVSSIEDLRTGGGADLTRAEAARIRAQRSAARPGTPEYAAREEYLNNVPGEAPRVVTDQEIADSLRKFGLNYTPEEIAARRAAPKGKIYQDRLRGAPAGSDVIPAAPRRGPDIARKIEDIGGVTKTLSTALSPFHFLFRHALPFLTAHPKAWAVGGIKGLREGFRMTPEELAARTQTMRDNLARNGGKDIYLGRPHLGAVGGEEESATSFLRKAPILGTLIERSGQGFVMGLNEVRYEAFKGAVNTSVRMERMGLARTMTAADRHALAQSINVFSGRGLDTANMSEAGKAALRLSNVPMFSPQLAVARVKMLGYAAKGYADVLNDLRAGRPVDPVALERARLGTGYIVGLGSLYALMQAAGGKVDLNPLSSTSGKVDVGTRGPAQAAVGLAASEIGMGFSAYPKQDSEIDPTASEATLVRAIARMTVATYDELTAGKGLKVGKGMPQSPMDIGTSYVINQLFSSPLTYPISEILRGYPAQPLDAVTPMPVSAALAGAGVQMPTVGGKPAKAATQSVHPSRSLFAPKNLPPRRGGLVTPQQRKAFFASHRP